MNKENALAGIESLIEQHKESLSNLESASAELRKALEASESYGRVKPEIGQEYWSISVYGRAISAFWLNNPNDRARWAMGNVYLTKEAVEKARNKKLAYVRIVDALAEANKGWVPDWGSSGQMKYFAIYDHKQQQFVVFSWTSMQACPIELIGTEEAWEQVIKTHEDDLKLYFGVE